MGVRSYSQPIKLVLADDQDHVRQLLRFLFDDDARFSVVGEAANGHEAIALAPLADAMVLDIAMPDLDGITALEELQVIAPSTAVIVYTAYDQPYLEAAALGQGAAGFISKATGFAALAEAVAAAAPTLASHPKNTEGRRGER
jgi:DNA-binding NarL/FixJ family response regulator